MTTLIALAGSTRRASYNRRLLDGASAELTALGAEVDLVEAEAVDIPIYNGDFQDAEGIPEAVIDLHDRFVAAQGILIASPEDNGAFSPLLKKTIEPHFSLPSASRAFTDEGLVAEEAVRLQAWAGAFLPAVGQQAESATADSET